MATDPRQPRTDPREFRGIVADLDGTLLRSDGTVSAETTEVIAAVRARRMPFVVATGRTPRGLRRIAGHHQLGTVACANGAIVWDAACDRILRQTSFDSAPALLAAIDGVRASAPDIAVAVLSADSMFLDARYVALRGKDTLGAELVTDLARITSEHRIAVVAFRHPHLDAEQLLPSISEAFTAIGVASFAGLTTVDVAPMGVTKAIAVAEVLAGAGCPLSATAVFGDMPNDLPLFAGSGWACAVANAHPLVLAAADEVVPSNDDDGVARTVRRILAA